MVLLSFLEDNYVLLKIRCSCLLFWKRSFSLMKSSAFWLPSPFWQNLSMFTSAQSWACHSHVGPFAQQMDLITGAYNYIPFSSLKIHQGIININLHCLGPLKRICCYSYSEKSSSPSLPLILFHASKMARISYIILSSIVLQGHIFHSLIYCQHFDTFYHHWFFMAGVILQQKL